MEKTSSAFKSALEQMKEKTYSYVKKSSAQRMAERLERKKRKHQNREAKEAARNGQFPDSIHGIPIVETDYKVPPMGVRKSMRKKFKDIRGDFLKHVGENCVEQLRAIGMKDSHIELVKSGRTPSGYNVHHKLPIHGGGKNEFSNFILMPIPPHDDLHHKIIDPQIKGINEGETRRIKMPMPEEMVFVPPRFKDNVKDFDNEKASGDISGDFEKGRYKGIKKDKWNNVMSRIVAKNKKGR